EDYRAYYQDYLDRDMLVRAGTDVPTWYGSVRNTFSWKSLEISAMLSWKGGYVFRRASMGPFDEYSDMYHDDYFRRWQQPGDERHTDVPRGLPLEENDTYMTVPALYEDAEVLVVPGGHIRLQDISAGYTLPERILPGRYIRGIRVYGYARNLGILWRHNDEDIDPDYPASLYRSPASYNIGLQLDF